MTGSLDSNWTDVFMTSAGRMSRLPFILACLVLLAISYAYEALLGHQAHLIAGWVYYPLMIFCLPSVLAKRLHDRGRAAWWSTAVLVAVWLVWPTPHGVIAFAAVPVLVWAVIDLAILPGQAGANQYGPSPLATPAV